MTSVADQNTDEMNGKRPFEDRVFARFDAFDARFNAVDARFDMVDARFDMVDARFNAVDSSIRNLDSRLENVESRLEKLEVRAYDTKPIWEQALREIVDTKRELSKRLARVEAVVYETRADL